MPRVARIKTNNSMFHIMIHSISEIQLFNDTEDKEIYLSLIKKAKAKFNFKLYAFALMNTHAHLVIDCFGSDISKVMHYLNLCYSIHYNNKYNRRGPVFQDRFKSKIIDSTKYLINVCSYIHANPKDLLGKDNKLINYPYNSLIDYMQGCNRFKILDSSFLVTLLGLNQTINKKQYYSFISHDIDTSIIKDVEIPFYMSQSNTTRTYIPRLLSPDLIINYVAHYLNVSPKYIYMKYSHEYTTLRALTCFMLHAFSNLSHKAISKLLGNISISRISSLINHGVYLASYISIIEDFIHLNAQ